MVMTAEVEETAEQTKITLIGRVLKADDEFEKFVAGARSYLGQTAFPRPRGAPAQLLVMCQ